MKFFKCLLHLLLIFGFFFVIASCSQKTTMQDVTDSDEPCWVSGSPKCDIEKDNYIYFVGQAMKTASRSRPGRAAFISAENDAKAQYVAYIEEMIQTKGEEAVTSAGDEIEGSQAIGAMKNLTKTFAQKTVKGLIRYDHYFISTAKNTAELPLWDVWVRMRVEKKEIEKKVDMLESNLQKSAAKGVENAEVMHKAIKKVQDSIKEDDFFEGF